MIKKAVLSYDVNVHRYFIPETMLTNNVELYYINLSLDPLQDGWISCDFVTHKNLVFIWSSNSFKEQAILTFKTLKEQYDFEDAYKKYYDKRWEEMPKVELSLFDWTELQQKWKKIKEEKPQYVIFTLDDSGPLDKVDVIGKNELSWQDVQDMKLEHEKYLKHEQARKKYIQNHPDYSDVWRSPADDEYEADIMKYYED